MPYTASPVAIPWNSKLKLQNSNKNSNFGRSMLSKITTCSQIYEADLMADNHSIVNKIILDEISNRFSALKTKQDVIRALENNSLLCRIPLPSPVVSVEQAHKDFRRERVLLNDVAFIPDNIDLNRCHAFSETLTVLLERMMRNKELYNQDLFESVDDITDTILQRACRTAAGSDSFFRVQNLLCVEDTVVTQKTFLHDPPIRVDVFTAFSNSVDDSASTCGSEVSGSDTRSIKSANLFHSYNLHRTEGEDGKVNSICSRILVQNSFALYDASAIDLITGNEVLDPTPWLEVEATVVDEVNYRTNEHDRALQLLITCPETGAVYQSASRAASCYSATPSKRSSGRLSDRLSGRINEISNWVASASSRITSLSISTPPPSVHNADTHHGGREEVGIDD